MRRTFPFAPQPGAAALLATGLVAAALLALPASAKRIKAVPAPKPAAGPAASCAATCPNQPLYADPKEPAAIDAEVLGLCPTKAGDRIEPDDARAFFKKHLVDPRLAAALREAAPHAPNDSARATWLAEIWTGPARRNAFTNVLCGDDWDREKPGGLHLEARYAQLEREGKICYGGPAHGGPAHDGQPCVSGQCMIRFGGLRGFSCGVMAETGGFLQEFDALDLLTAGTRAFAACCMRREKRDRGLYAGPRGVTFQIWCGERNGRFGIAGFYPSAGPPDCGP